LEAGTIAELVRGSLALLTEFLDIRTELVPTSAIYENQHLKGQERILDICRQEKATRYINPIGGRELYDKDLFRAEGIELFFHQSRRVAYPQAGNDFVPWLSVADVLLYNDPAAVRAMLTEYDLV